MSSTRILLQLAVLAGLAGGPVQAGIVAASPAPQRAARHLLPPVDVERLLAEDEVRSRDGGPWRVGLRRRVALSPADAGTWETLPDGARRWTLRVESPGARWLVLGFGRFHLPAGARLEVRGLDPRTRIGPFGAADARPHGQLWLPPLPGDVAILELRWPARLRERRPDLRLDAVSHGYRDAWGASDGEAGADSVAGSCNVDVNCPLGDPWQDVKRGVVQILIDGSLSCTASLVNTTENACRPYLLTAAHCVASAGDAASTLVRFNFEHPLCESGEVATEQTLSGASLVATHAASDFTLLELDQEPPADFEVFFNGWSRSAKPPESSWTVHHPQAGVKKISYDADPATDGGATGWGTDHWRVLGWDEGTTEAGSSGAPLLDPAGRIIGQLHGGTASCASDTWDEFGKLRAAWAGGGAPSSRLCDWLDPFGSGVESVAGIDARACARAFGDDPVSYRPLRPPVRPVHRPPRPR
jgi:hypothetical protein